MDHSDLEASTERNRRAWNAQRFEAWMSRYKSPEVEARVIAANPQHVTRRIYPYLGEVEGKQICNVQGSHGRMAVALALMGADVHVIDFSEENQKFASALANAAGVKIDYTVCDILNISQVGLRHRFDSLVLELGILHYHQDLDRFFVVMRYGQMVHATIFTTKLSKQMFLIRNRAVHHWAHAITDFGHWERSFHPR